MPSQAGRVLIVDDDDAIRVVYRRFLEKAGFEVVEAADGREAITRARTDRPQVIVMDLAMPNMDGPTAIRMLKTNAVLKEIPIIVVTGFVTEGWIARAKDAGCDQVLREKTDLDGLVELIRRLLRDRKG